MKREPREERQPRPTREERTKPMREERPTKPMREDRQPRVTREERTPRDEPEDPPPRAPTPRNLEWMHGELDPKVKATVNGHLRYRKEKGVRCEQNRWYLMGAVFIAFVQVHKRDTYKHGNYAVFMTSAPGNGGSWFKEEEEVHEFIKRELERAPKG